MSQEGQGRLGAGREVRGREECQGREGVRSVHFALDWDGDGTVSQGGQGWLLGRGGKGQGGERGAGLFTLLWVVMEMGR